MPKIVQRYLSSTIDNSIDYIDSSKSNSSKLLSLIWKKSLLTSVISVGLTFDIRYIVSSKFNKSLFDRSSIKYLLLARVLIRVTGVLAIQLGNFDKQSFSQIANLDRETRKTLFVFFVRFLSVPIRAALPLIDSTPLEMIDPKNSISSKSKIKNE